MYVRISPITAEEIDRLRLHSTLGKLAEYASAEKAASKAMGELDEVLFEAIGAADNAGRKRELLRTRRQLRHKGSIRADDLIGVSLKVSSARDAFEVAKHDLYEAYRGLRTTFEEEVGSTAEHLEVIAKNPEISNAIQCAAPSLAELLVNSGQSSERTSLRGIRHDRLARFVYRAAAKTSPYSTFTLTGKVAKNQGTPLANVAPNDVQLVRQIDGRLVAAVAADVARNVSESDRVKWRVNPSLTQRRPAENGYLVLAEPPAESIRSMPRLPLLDYLYERRHQSPVAFEELESETAYALRISLAEARSALVSARAVGILQCEVPISEITLDPLGMILAWIGDLGDVAEPPYAAQLSSLRRYLNRSDNLVGGSTSEHLASRQNAISDAETIAADLNIRDIDVYIHESSQIHPAVSCVKPDANVLRTVSAAYAWLSLLDTKLPARLMFGNYVAEKYGTDRVPLLDLYLDYERLIRDNDDTRHAEYAYWFNKSMPQPESFHDSDRLPESIRRLRDLRSRQQALVDATRPIDGIIRIPLSVLEDFMRKAPKALMCRQGGTAYLQQADQHSGEWVVNVFHGGNGRGYARMDYLRAAAVGVDESFVTSRGEANERPIRRGRDGGARLLAEYSGIHGSSLNMRVPVLDVVIDYPYVAAEDGSGRRRVQIADIAVEYDRCDELAYMVVAATGERLTPVHLGMMADYQLSPLARFMERFFGETYLLHPSNPPFASSFSLASLRGITEIPRLQVGDVVVRRRRWIVEAGILPSYDSHASDLDRWLTLRDWFEQNGLPSRCYLRSWPGLGSAEASVDTKSRKPMYFDLDSWWCIAPMIKRDMRVGFLVLDEALPDIGRHKDQARCSELLVEFASWFGTHSGGDN
ncbi:lantibiotic dehydratase [Actinomyces ruminicola]|uniref:lantibiotic dehydratase n=1 Tax=Actinomyces ruminicola TaxID=332524 RepID=UPI0011C97A2D|nr:lantibiotic dehydratase [Actinomyces ruminicola]